MKILMTADTIGGVWTYALELVRELQPYGCEVALATMGKCLSTEQRREADQIPNLTIFESNYKLEWMDDPWGDVAEAEAWLLEVADQVQPELVHLNSYAHGALDWHVPVLMVGHSCVLSWWQAVKAEPAPRQWHRYQCQVQAGLNHADLVVAPTRAMLTALQMHYGPLAATGVIYNGRNPAHFPPRRKEPMIFSVGRLWDEAKNVGLLDKIAADLSWPIYVAGEAAHPAGGQEQLHQVQHLGKLSASAVADWMARASIYALPARYEPFGLSVLEAAMAGCALVLGDIESLREVWGDAARYVPPDDQAAFTELLQELMDDPAGRRALGSAAQQQANRYCSSNMGAAYWQTYCDLLVRQPSQRQAVHAHP
jgi:glycogen(starch) synthase